MALTRRDPAREADARDEWADRYTAAANEATDPEAADNYQETAREYREDAEALRNGIHPSKL